MKLSKKILAFVMAMSILVSMPAFALTFPDVETNNSNRVAIDVLSSLGIVKGYDNGKFEPEKTVTREEMASLNMRVLNLSSISVTVPETGFTDVESTRWSAADIKTASDRGIVLGYGDGLFGPEDLVTLEQAVKMIVATLGYTDKANFLGGWPDGYMATARDLGIMDKVNMNQKDPAPRKIIAQILYNALQVDLMEKKIGSDEYVIVKDKNILNTYLKYEKYEGTLIANSQTRLDANESTLLEDEIEILTNNGIKKFKVAKLAAESNELLGLKVVAYAKDDEYKINKELIHIMPKSTPEQIKIDAGDIQGNTTISELVYAKDSTGKEFRVKFASNPIFIYNGKYIDANYAYTNGLYPPKIGSVTAINSGSGYDLISIESYNNYVVKNVDTEKYIINMDLPANGSLYVPYKETFDYKISITKDGKDHAFNSIRKGMILTVKQTDASQTGIKLIDIKISDTKKTGRIEGREDDSVTIDGKQYLISKSLDGNEIKDKLVYNANGTFYLDIFGQIAYTDFTASIFKYGYITKAVVSTANQENNVVAKLFDYTTKQLKTVTFNDRVIFDGSSMSNPETILEKIEQAAQSTNKGSSTNNSFSQPVRYMTNNSGKITEIDTIISSGSNNEFVPVPGFEYDTNDVGYIYNASNRYFADSTGQSVAKINTKTMIFSVPDNRYEDKKYGIKTTAYFKDGGQYRFEIFELDSEGMAKVMVLYESNQDEDVHYQSPTVVVKEIRKEVLVGDELKAQLIGYDFNTGSEVTYTSESIANIENLVRGDVIRFGVNSLSEINGNVYKYVDIASASVGTVPLKRTLAETKDKSNYPVRTVMMQQKISDSYVDNRDILNLANKYAYINAFPVSANSNEGSLSIVITDTMPDEGDFATANKKTLAISADDSIKFFVYDKKETSDAKKLQVHKPSTAGDISARLIDLKTNELQPGNEDRVFCYIYDDKIKSIYIIKQ